MNATLTRETPTPVFPDARHCPRCDAWTLIRHTMPANGQDFREYWCCHNPLLTGPDACDYRSELVLVQR